jgi:hypothetical protein
MSNIEKKLFIQRIDKKIRIAAAGVVLAASLGMGMEACTNQPDKPGITTTISGETAQPRLTSENWMTIPQSEIKKYSVVPNIADGLIDDKEYLSTVSPALQEQAKALGYTIIYQGDPNDTTGRSVLTEKRQSDGNITSGGYYDEDRGFGENGIGLIKGVFIAWVPNPSDPQQLNDVYALLENPLTKQDYLIDIKLGASDRKTFDANCTCFDVDDLNNGYQDILNLYKKTNNLAMTIMFDDAKTHPNTAMKGIYDDFSFNDLLVKKGINLDDIAKPGDYIWAINQANTGAVVSKNKDNIQKINVFIVRRFGGNAAWAQEAGIK